MNCNYLHFGIFLIVVQVAVSVFPPDVIEGCKKEVGFDKKMKDLDFNSSSFPKEAKCFLSCGLKKVKVLKEDGSINKDNAITAAEAFEKDDEKKAKLVKAINECKDEVKVQADTCETAFEYIKCKKSKLE